MRAWRAVKFPTATGSGGQCYDLPMPQKLLVLALSLCISSISFPTHSEAADAGKPLWDSWYTVGVNNTPYAYYNEKVELKKDRVVFLHRMWKLEEGFLNEEQLGAVSANNPELTPMFFNYRSVYRGTEKTMDGTLGDKDRALSVTVKAGDPKKPEAKIYKKVIPKGVIFSQFFPVWLGLKLPSLKPGKSTSFSTILEDDASNGFTPVGGNVTVESPDEFAKKSGTTRLKVVYRGETNHWWVNDKGMAEKIEMPKSNVLVQKVTQEKAEAFLKGSTPPGASANDSSE